MIYAYRCRSCGLAFDSNTRDDPYPCHVCGGLIKRDYSTVQLSTPTFKPHFNHAVGQYVSNTRQFSDALKVTSDMNSEATGMDHHYVRVDPGDVPRPDTATEAFEVRSKFIRDNNINERTL